LRALAQRLSFEQERGIGDDRWLLDSAKQTMTICPDEYSVYAALTRSNGSLLAVVRTGANNAPAALAHSLPKRIGELAGLPTALGAAATETARRSDNSLGSGDKGPAACIAAVTPIVQALRTETQSGDDKSEPTWSALGELIFEEQFVEAANYLEIAGNGTERSHADEVKSILPAIKGHRYARHIESYALKDAPDRAQFYGLIGDMQVVDPRGNMQPMMSRIWRMDNGKGRKSRGSDASWNALFDRGITYSGMIEAYDAVGNFWWKHLGKSMQKRWADDFRAISPHSPQTLGFAIAVTDNPSYKQVRQWESEAGEDPTVFRTLASLYAQLEHSDDAIRAYEHSIKLSPSQAAFMGLAETYRNSGQEELWQPTLERFFKVESLGLDHANVHQMIADELIEKNKWNDAKPHAIAAAETGSSWGLDLASRVEEGLGHWDDSEKWIRLDSNSYPSSAGGDWYFWCRRTGRGDREAARKIAEPFFHEERLTRDYEGQLKLLTFHLLENDTHAALENAKKALELADETHTPDYDMILPQLHVAFVARELKDTDAVQASIKEIRRLSERFRGELPHFTKITVAICDILDGKAVSENVDSALHDQFSQAPKLNRCNYVYFVGRAYDLAGKQDLADKYFKRCVTQGPYDCCAATLAGKYLCDRHKTSRP
jgi:tetratricopeptide (TPR) repeat protein